MHIEQNIRKVIGFITKPYNEALKLPAEMTSEENNITGIKVDYTTIGQYIGITDKYNSKIFEGDIVKITDDEDIYIVEYNDEEAIFEVTGQFNCVCYNFSLELFGHDVEVIGNIYDNPELIVTED